MLLLVKMSEQIIKVEEENMQPMDVKEEHEPSGNEPEHLGERSRISRNETGHIV